MDLPYQAQDFKTRLDNILQTHPGQFGNVAQMAAENPNLTAKDIVQAQVAANDGAASTLLLRYKQMHGDIDPATPGVAKASASTLKALLKAQKSMDEDIVNHLSSRLTVFEAISVDDAAAEREQQELEQNSNQLDDLYSITGIYVYTYPHYWRYPLTPGTDARMLKIGCTTGKAGARITSQVRDAAAPEDPLILRVYETVPEKAKETERIFHRLLDAAHHGRAPGKTAGREWFETHIEFLDEVALLLGLVVFTGEE